MDKDIDVNDTIDRLNRSQALMKDFGLADLHGDELANAIDRLLIAPGVNSTNRLDRLLTLTEFVEPSVFWSVFHRNWSMCDDTWSEQDYLLDHLRYQNLEEPSYFHMTTENKAFYDGLKRGAVIYRGCSRERIWGLSWTTDRQIAEKFARGHRGLKTQNPVLIRTKVARSSVMETIISVSVERGESEVLIDPDQLGSLIVEPYEAA